MILVIYRTNDERTIKVQQYLWSNSHLAYRESTTTLINLGTGHQWRCVVATDDRLLDKVCGQIFESVEGIENVPEHTRGAILARVRKELRP
jgi:hypothetical protein